MLLGQPETNLVIAGKAVRVLEFFLQGRQGWRGDALAQGRPRDLITEHLVDPTLGVGLKPRRDTMTMDAEEVCDVLAVVGSPARGQIERLQALALLNVFLLFHALVQGVSTFGNGRHPFPHIGAPPAAIGVGRIPQL
jgi:hypothetical protein